jgi:DNA replication and repair protein RecF
LESVIKNLESSNSFPDSRFPIPDSTKPFHLSKLLLNNFRNYSSLSLTVNPSPVVITGPNGSGKTNILEAISFLSPGKGLRKIALQEADKISENGRNYWSISATIKHGYEELQIGTGRDQLSKTNKRIVRVDGDNLRSNAELASFFSVMWLTPQMDGIFIGSSSERRKFLDRLVYNFDPEHASRVYSYEYTMRERAKLLQNKGDASWLSVLENKLAERAVSIAAARIDTVETIKTAIIQSNTLFPKAQIAVDGFVESLLAENSALAAEELIRKNLFDNRGYDYATGRTRVGTHRSDFVVTHIEKNMPAASCSTGEQKALLLSIILAEARAKAAWKNSVPVLLLDEVVAHLDEARRASLFNELIEMNTQVWLTGTDLSLFENLQGRAQFLYVEAGEVTDY